MSQNPSSYLPPTGYSYGMSPDDPLSHARRAGILMIVLGILMLLQGTCSGISSMSLTPDEIQKQINMMPPEAQQMYSPHLLRVSGMVMCGMVQVCGVFFL